MKRGVALIASGLAILLVSNTAWANAASAPAATAAALDPAKLAIARDIVNVVLPPDRREKIMETALDNMLRNLAAGALRGVGAEDDIKQNPQLRAAFERFIERQRDLAMGDLREAMPSLSDAYAHAYARMFSMEDLQGIKAFVQTSAGAHYVQRGSLILADPDVADWQRKLAAKGMARQDAELARFKAELLEIRTVKPSKT